MRQNVSNQFVDETSTLQRNHEFGFFHIRISDVVRDETQFIGCSQSQSYVFTSVAFQKPIRYLSHKVGSRFMAPSLTIGGRY